VSSDLSFRLFVTGTSCARAGKLIHESMQAEDDVMLAPSLWIELGFATELLLNATWRPLA
jgi:hypothetical protein